MVTRRPLPMKNRGKSTAKNKTAGNTEEFLDSLLKKEPSKTEIEDIWARSWRPNVVICVTNHAKVLMCFHEKFSLWQFPQGGIEPGESVLEALAWELSEELGEEFAQSCMKSPVFLGADRITFRSKATIQTNPTQGEPQEIKIKGKVYYIYQVTSATAEIDVGLTDFSRVRWCDFREGNEICDSIYQRSKQDLTRKTLKLLNDSGVIE